MAYRSLVAFACVLCGCVGGAQPRQLPQRAPNTVTVTDPSVPPPRPVQSEPKAGTVPRRVDPGAPPPSPLAAPELSPAPPPAQPDAPADPAHEPL